MGTRTRGLMWLLLPPLVVEDELLMPETAIIRDGGRMPMFTPLAPLTAAAADAMCAGGGNKEEDDEEEDDDVVLGPIAVSVAAAPG